MGTTIVIDHFTGAPDTDIDTRVPDGFIGFPPETPDTNPEKVCLDAGQWSRVQYSPSTGTFDLIADVFVAGVAAPVGANNSASIVVAVPPHVSGQLLLLVVYSRDGTARLPTVPSGFTSAKLANGTSVQGALLAAYRIADGTEPSTYTVTFTGAGVANTTQVAQMIALDSPTGSPIGVVGSTATWLSANNLGPVTGITPGASPSIVLLLAAKQNDFNLADITALTTTSGTWSRLMEAEETAGNDAAFAVFAQYQDSGTAISSTSVSDSGQAGAGIGFMLELLVSAAPTIHECRHKAIPGADGNWNHYVIKDLVLGNDYMTEASFTVLDYAQTEWIAVLTRHDPVYEIGYELNVLFSGGGAFASWFLYRVDPPVPAEGTGVYVEIASGFGVSLTPGDPILLQLCISGAVGDVHLDAWINTEQVVDDEVDVNTSHTALWPGDADPSWPGACLSDLSRTGRAIKLNYIRADPTCGGAYPEACEEEPPCEGGPENPYPTDPPPVEEITGGIWGNENNAFRKESETSPNAVQAYSRGAARNRFKGWVMASGAWREFGGITDTDPPPNTTYPPYYDPCEELPPLPPPEDVDLGPPPDRLMFAYELPITNIGDLFTAAVNASGPWTPSDATSALSRGGYIIANQGGYSKFRTNGGTGNYDPDLHKAWISSVAGYVLSAQATGTLYGIQIFDDWEVPRLWPPSGVSVATLEDVCGYAASAMPGVRIGIRARAQQFSPGSYPGNVEFIISQYRYWGLNGQTPSSYLGIEKGLAATFGWRILWSINLQHGGALINGIRYPMSLAQAAAALAVFTGDGDNNDGVGCWKFDMPTGGSGNWFAQPGAIDVWAQARNDLALLGPP